MELTRGHGQGDLAEKQVAMLMPPREEISRAVAPARV